MTTNEHDDLHAAIAAQVGTGLPYLNWLLNHLTDAPALSADVQTLIGAQSVPARWAAFKPIGDMIFTSWAADFPGAAAAASTPATAQQIADMIRARHEIATPASIYAKIGDGNIANGLANLLKVVVPYLPLILSLFGVPVPAIPVASRAVEGEGEGEQDSGAA